MRKAFIILTGILFTLLFATCKQFTADIDDYLSRWSTEAFILSSTIDKKTYNDGSSIPSVASANDVTVTLKVQNHKSFQFIMPSASETRNIVEFAHFTGTKPAVSADYELKQLTADTLQLVYKADFLKNSEWGEKDVSSTITLYADDGRPPFKQTFTVPLKANTPPPTPGFTVVKTKASPAYYVLCIKVPDMDKTVPGGLLHKDLARIEVNGAPYTFSVNEAQTAFTKPEADVFITHSDVKKLDEPDAAAVPADSSWVLYYKTDVEVKDGAAKKDYTVRLADAQGLVSGILNASTKPNKAENETIRITKGTKISGSGSEADPIIIGTGSAGAELTASSPTANTTVHCTVSEIGGSTPVKYDGNPVTVPLPLNGAGEKLYKLEYYTDGEGFAATPVKTIYYKVVQGHTVTYLVDGGNGKIQSGSDTAVSSGTVSVLHGGNITFTAQPDEASGYEVDSWTGAAANTPNTTATLSNVTGDTTVTVKFKKKTYPVTFSVVGGNGTLKATPEGGAENLTGSITVEHGTLVTFTATPTDPTHYKVGDWTCEPSEGFTGASGQANATLTVTAHTTVSVQFVELNALTSTTFKIHGQDASAGSVTLPYAKAQVTKGDIELEFSGHTGLSFTVSQDPLTLAAGETKPITIDVAASPGNYPAWRRTVNITRSLNDVAELTSFTLNGVLINKPLAGPYEVESDMAEVKDFVFNTTNSAGATASVSPSGNTAIAAGTGTSFTITVKAQDGTETPITFTVKRKKHPVTYSVVKVNGPDGLSEYGKIQAGGGPQTTGGTVSVEHGSSQPFTAAPDLAWEVDSWSFDDHVVGGTNESYTSPGITTDGRTVTVKFKKITTVRKGNNFAWRLLKEVVRIADDNAVITIDGKIEATYGDNAGEIKIDKNLKIKGAPGGDSDILDADSESRIFKVESGKTLTLENLTLTGGKAEGTQDADNYGGAIYASGATVNITNCTLKGNEAVSGGGAIYARKEGSTASTITISGGSINGNTVTDDYGFGGGIYINDGCELTLKGNVTVKGNKAARGGGVRANKSTVTMNSCTFEGNESTHGDASNGCGGVYVNGGTVSMQSCTLKSNKGNVRAGGLLVEGGAKVTMDGCTLTGNTATTGGGIYITGGSSIVTLNNGVQIKDNTATTGGGVYVQDGTFKMSGSAIVTPSTGSDQYTPGKNDVYLKTGQAITVDGTLSNNPAARITPEEYKENVPVLRGGSDVTLKNETGKFIVPPQKVTEDSENWNVFWYIADNGNLKAEVEDPDMLKTVIDGSPNNTIIKLGNISDLKTVEIWGYRKIMLKADRAVTLTCSSKGNEYKHLQVKEHASLILKGLITLQGADYGSNTQYALYVENWGKAEIKNGVTITGFKNGNIGPVVSDGELTMSGGEISGNKAKNGGGVYIHAAHRSFTMTGGTIKGNLATEHGGGVYVNADVLYNMYGKFTMTGGKIEGNTADKGGGVFTHGIFTMGKEDGGTGGTITKNTATNDGKAVMLNHHFYWEAGEIKDNLGSGSVIGGNTHYYLHNTSSNTES